MEMKNIKAFVITACLFFICLKMYGKEKYESPIYTQYAVEIIRSFANQVEKEFGLECIGSGGSMPHDVQEISVKFIVYQDVTIPQARELEVKLTEKLVQVINAHEKIRPFLREYPFPSSRACISLSFERPRKNFSIKNQIVKYVFQARGRIFYQAENPLNEYVYKDIKDEPYEEALKIVQSQITKNTP